jgi:hypothetical protein
MKGEQIVSLVLAIGILLVFLAIFGANQALKRQGI